MESGLTKQRILAELSRSAHGELKEYLPIGKQAAKAESEFFAHLIAWDRAKGQVRDAKVALPIVALSVAGVPEEFIENALAHLTMLNPRELLKAYRFALEVKLPGRMRAMRRLIGSYLEEKQKNWPRFERTALQHRKVLKELYALTDADCGDKARALLFGVDRKTGKRLSYPEGSLFQIVAQLKDMSPIEAAGTIIERKIPFLIARGALGAKAKEPELVLALLKAMTPNEVINNTKAFQELGVKTDPALRGAFEAALERASKSTSNVLKATTAVDAVEDEELKEKLRGVQERQIEKFGGVDGRWLVLADKSGSMSQAIEVSRHVSATLAKMVKGKVWLVFFDTMPHAMDVTGLALDAIKAKTKHVQADGGTSIGCGLQRMLDNHEEIDGIAIISDAGENTAPLFPAVYKRYSTEFGKDVPVYLYQCDGDRPDEQGQYLLRTMKREEIDMQVFDLRGTKIDYVSLPNMVATMRTSRYSLVEEIMATKLLTLRDVFKGQVAAASA